MVLCDWDSTGDECEHVNTSFKKASVPRSCRQLDLMVWRHGDIACISRESNKEC